MSSPPSGSNQTSSAFELLAPAVQRWIYDQGWTELRDAQELAVPTILHGERDLLIAAATASGKTEAAFLPICSSLVARPSSTAGVEVLYVAPLKALINDQFRRLDGLCEHLDIPVHRWHGDVGAGHKKHLTKNPRGALLTTPESLEAMFVLRGPEMPGMFAALRYVIVDELHSFLGTERGAQLRSLLHRIELCARRRIPRIGLSATLGDMKLAAEQLRPGHGSDVQIILSNEGGQELQLQIRGYVDTAPPTPSTTDATLAQDDGAVRSQIAQHLFTTLRGSDNLVFANARGNVELYAAKLRELCQGQRLPNEFFAHHGSLSKELREDAEAALKDPSKPATAVCTTTLEMGLDIGSVSSIAQVGAPPSVASLRQRLGRSGRRAGEPAVLRVYVTEPDIDERTPLPDAIRAQLMQSVAMIELLLEGWCEPPAPAALHLSTLVQQLLSIIAQHGGVTAAQAHRVLCGPGGPFGNVTPPMFADLLRELGARDVLTQAADGTLLHGPRGEQTVNHYSFYTAFITPEEYRLVEQGRHLGTVPIDFPLYPSLLIIFGGRRWRVLSVDSSNKVVELARASGGRPPSFPGGPAAVHDTVRQKMRELYESDVVPRYLDSRAKELLSQGRAAYARYRLDEVHVVADGQDSYLLPWTGDVTMNTLAVQLSAQRIAVSRDGVAIGAEGLPPEQVLDALQAIAAAPPADALAVAAAVENKEREKYDGWLSESLLALEYASRSLNIAAAHATAAKIIAE